ncbi:MAG: AAA family ATPase [Patescibacteria group bacterium]|nr:AAA family ATPase [Patescibacteria group bacterium]
MYLKRLELQGFKTFAQKTALEFLSEEQGRRGVTGVVGPNGSGKSNIADSLRWVMGEQSMRLLRSKKSEDVIFSGSAKKPRAGFAEVSLTMVNDGNDEIDLPEIVITRRLYRDGQSEYEINKKAVRMSDVVMLLAQCGVGQRTYSVIGQGMVDAVLSASPGERKEFFDEASGLKPFQLKRQSAVLKLDATHENLRQAELLLREIEPRLSSLERQVKRLKQREAIEEELRGLEKEYFGGAWAEIRERLKNGQAEAAEAKRIFGERNAEAEKIEQELAALEKATPVSSELREVRQGIDALKEERAKLRERQIRLESRREVAKVQSAKPWSPLPLSKIIDRIEKLNVSHDELLKELGKETPDMALLKKLAAELKSAHESLLSQLQQPAPEVKETPQDPELEKEMTSLLKDVSAVSEKILAAERQLQELNAKEDKARSHLFELQRALTAKRHDVQREEQKLSAANVALARHETRRDAYLAELRQQAPGLEGDVERLADTINARKNDGELEVMRSRIQRLRSQLEFIGGIDPETIKEYETTKLRFDTLSTQSIDLREAMKSLQTVLEELDKTIKEKGDVAFRQLNHEFGVYFKKLFNGGDAELIKVEPEDVAEGEGSGEDGEVAEQERADAKRETSGIEIHATPPGKRLKAIALLSGGERALTSIALICAIMAINPSPFVVLDEVDAALDESNSRKFAEIVDSLSGNTQFIVVTHNRATMDKADVLYGVTMGDDGVSQLLSVNLEGREATKNAK